MTHLIVLPLFQLRSDLQVFLFRVLGLGKTEKQMPGILKFYILNKNLPFNIFSSSLIVLFTF